MSYSVPVEPGKKVRLAAIDPAADAPPTAASARPTASSAPPS